MADHSPDQYREKKKKALLVILEQEAKRGRRKHRVVSWADPTAAWQGRVFFKRKHLDPIILESIVLCLQGQSARVLAVRKLMGVQTGPRGRVGPEGECPAALWATVHLKKPGGSRR